MLEPRAASIIQQTLMGHLLCAWHEADPMDSKTKTMLFPDKSVARLAGGHRLENRGIITCSGLPRGWGEMHTGSGGVGRGRWVEWVESAWTRLSERRNIRAAS